MNKLIKELAKQAKVGSAEFDNGIKYFVSTEETFNKFAELIVRECIKEITDQMFYEGIDESNNPGYYKAINRIEEHFGVKE